jgi:F420-0:gamma-glutamyl ligase
LFNYTFTFSQANVADSLASAAVVAMGEGKECTPIAIISDIPFVQFRNKTKRITKKYSSHEVPLKEDLYAPFLQHLPWRKGGS